MNKTAIASTIALSIVLAACAGGDDDEVTSGTIVAPADTTVPQSTVAVTTTEPPPTTTTTVAPTTTEAPVDDVLRMPLTGEPIDDVAQIPDRPALVVKLTNAGRDAVPQAGLNSADIVIEEVINDSVSRLAGVFHSTDADPIGPVRSGRAQDVDVLLALDRPLFAWSGGNPAVTSAIRASDLVDIDARFAPGFYRRQARSSPNNLYTSADVLWPQATDEAGRPDPVFPYVAPGDEVTGEPATRIDLEFDSTEVRWGYDEASGRYFRRQNGAPHNSEEGGDVEQVWTDNVVVMLADYGVNVFDGNPEAQVLGSNRVLVFTGGTVQEGVWIRFEPTDEFGLFDNLTDLNELQLQPGRTWLEIPRNREGTVSWSN